VFFVTLAGTSVGRGWDSVGHAPGTYRNRMKIEWVDAEEAMSARSPAPAVKESATTEQQSDEDKALEAIRNARRLTTQTSEPQE
jgi:hypothetical protein